jgi:ABC-2 type transport system ATP-binding protein
MIQPSDLAIRTRGLRKVFGGKVAVRNLTLDVPRGEVFGFLGPNGAGKSTCVKMLLGLVFPTSGQADVLGQPAGDVRARSKVGFLPEHFRFYDWLTPAELLKLHGRLYGMSQGVLRERIPTLLDLVGLTPHREKRLQEFSKGMLQRIGLAQALLNDPELIFLDEPTSGLDPFGRRMVRDVIKAQRDRGATVLLNSHLLGEVEITCDRVAFIKDGEVVETRTLEGEAKEQNAVLIRAGRITVDMVKGLAQWTSAAQYEEGRLAFSLSANAILPEIVRYLVSAGADIYEVAPQRLSLEERFLEIVGSDRGM